MPKKQQTIGKQKAIVEEVSPTTNHFSIRNLLIALFICLLLTVVISGYFLVVYQQSQNIATKEKLTSPEAQSLVNRLGQLMQLPSHETPTIATVTDVTKLVSQPFFASAENGDKVFIYAVEQKAILYRPSINKIINVGPINTHNSVPTYAQTSAGTTSAASISATQAQQQTTPSQVAIYNGTTTNNLTKTYQNKLVSQFPTITISLKTNAQNKYPYTQVIAIDGTQTILANKIAQYLHAKVESLPVGEVKPNAAILIILGKDAVK